MNPSVFFSSNGANINLWSWIPAISSGGGGGGVFLLQQRNKSDLFTQLVVTVFPLTVTNLLSFDLSILKCFSPDVTLKLF